MDTIPDFKGRPVAVGDRVAYATLVYRRVYLRSGVVVKIGHSGEYAAKRGLAPEAYIQNDDTKEGERRLPSVWRTSSTFLKTEA